MAAARNALGTAPGGRLGRAAGVLRHLSRGLLSWKVCARDALQTEYRITGRNCKYRRVYGESRYVSPSEAPTGGESSPRWPHHSPCGGFGACRRASCVVSSSSFSKMGSTARSCGRPAARLLLMISARAATRRRTPPKCATDARLKRPANERIPWTASMKSTCSPSASRTIRHKGLTG